MVTPEGLAAIAKVLAEADEEQINALRARLRIGVHRQVEVTDVEQEPPPVVFQAFCSALPVAYAGGAMRLWAPFATLVLEASYEATLLAAVQDAAAGGSNTALLTLLGGGAFGNDEAWILRAMRRALDLVKDRDLDVRIVCYGRASSGTVNLVRIFNGA